MPVSAESAALIESRLPAPEVTRERARAYMGAADLHAAQFAKHVGYSKAALYAFLSDTYTTSSRIARTDVMIRFAIEDYIARHPLNLASLTGDAQRLYETENVREIRHWFEHCHENRALAFIYGPPGSQKSFVLQYVIAEFNRRELGREASANRAYYVYVSVDIRPRDLLRKMCAECGAPVGPTVQSCMSSLRHHLRHTQTVFVLDEAQHASIAALEAIRELYDAEPRIGCLLAGSHELKQFFDQRAAELEQWNSRLDAGIELTGVSDECARAIFAVECPELASDQVDELIAGSRVADPYSAKRGHTYLSMRRVFKTIAEIHRNRPTQPTTEAPETLQ